MNTTPQGEAVRLTKALERVRDFAEGYDPCEWRAELELVCAAAERAALAPPNAAIPSAEPVAQDTESPENDGNWWWIAWIVLAFFSYIALRGT